MSLFSPHAQDLKFLALFFLNILFHFTWCNWHFLLLSHDLFLFFLHDLQFLYPFVKQNVSVFDFLVFKALNMAEGIILAAKGLFWNIFWVEIVNLTIIEFIPVLFLFLLSALNQRIVMSTLRSSLVNNYPLQFILKIFFW